MGSTEELLTEIASLTSGLVYVSETDASVDSFTAGKFSGDLAGDVLKFSDPENSARLQRVAFDDFFWKLSTKQEWHSSSQSERADRFRRLGEFLKSNLKTPIVFRIGEIRVQIFVVGVDDSENVSGVKTFAVET